jgi:hypothetical protein
MSRLKILTETSEKMEEEDAITGMILELSIEVDVSPVANESRDFMKMSHIVFYYCRHGPELNIDYYWLHHHQFRDQDTDDTDDTDDRGDTEEENMDDDVEEEMAALIIM